MELRDIEYFAVIAQHGHLGRAAEALRLTQPALSKSLRRLEDAVEAKLVKRTPKGVELTPEGGTLLERVRGLRLSLQDVAREVKDVSAGRVGHLRVGVGEPIGEYILPAAFEEFLRDSPKVSLRIEVSDNDVMLPALLNGELDLVVNYLAYLLMPSLPEGIAYEKLYEDDMVVIARAGHPLTRRKRVTLAELAATTWALTERVLQPYRLLERASHAHGLPSPRMAMECRSSRLRFASIAC